MQNDMTLIGLFKVINPAGFLANLAAEGTGIELAPWINVGAQAVIKARARLEGAALAVDFFLYDVARGAAPVLSKTYRGSAQVSAPARPPLRRRRGQATTPTSAASSRTKIAFAAGNAKAKTSHVYVMDYDGYGPYRVSSTGNLNVLPAWGPGGQLVYTSWLWNNPDLFVISGGGGRASRISKQPGLNTGAAWSPSGNSIALYPEPRRQQRALSRSARAAPSSAGSPTTRPSTPRRPGRPTVGSIAFVSDRGGNPQIYVMSAAGGGARRLTFKGGYNQEPSWCPRQETPLVAFTGRDEAGNFDIFTINVQTGELKRLTQGQGSCRSPSWAPNGRLLVYRRPRRPVADGQGRAQPAPGAQGRRPDPGLVTLSSADLGSTGQRAQRPSSAPRRGAAPRMASAWPSAKAGSAPRPPAAGSSGACSRRREAFSR